MAAKPKVTIKTLLEAGCHYGHQTRRWDPRMKPFIFGERNDIYIIDLKKTIQQADRAYTFLNTIAKKGGTILFVGTKKQAQEAIVDNANRCGMPFISNRWLGGMLTNFVTIQARVERMKELERMEESGQMAMLPKKEQSVLNKELEKLQKNLGGVRNMSHLPQALFVVDTMKEEIAVKEANRLGIPVVGLLDTNSNPELIEYGIPANDDAIRSISLLVEVMADAIEAGSKKSPVSLEEMKGGAKGAKGAVKGDVKAVSLQDLKDVAPVSESTIAAVEDVQPEFKDEKTTDTVGGEIIEAVTTPDLAEKLD